MKFYTKRQTRHTDDVLFICRDVFRRCGLHDVFTGGVVVAVK